MPGDVVVGVDGGGSRTRVAVVDIRGNLLSYAESGAASVKKDLEAAENVRRAVRLALERCGRRPNRVRGVVAGVAGYDSESDLEWVSALTRLDGLDCPRRHVNDSLIAQVGAFLFDPGIVAISGTGSIVFGVNEGGRGISNYQFRHYAATAARFLSFEAVFAIIAGETDKTDAELIVQILQRFGAKDRRDLAARGADGFFEDRQVRNRHFGDLAPLVTAAALRGSHAAQRVCTAGARALATGIALVASGFASREVPVALIGSVINSPWIRADVVRILERKRDRVYRLVEPALPAVLGAAAMALRDAGVSVDEHVVASLKAPGADLRLSEGPEPARC
jgi:glucosamine kinase